MALDEAPPFWWIKNAWQAWALSPLGLLYGRVAAARMDAKPDTDAGVPVICVGNFVAGGAGKTPTVKMLCKHLKSQKMKPGVLTRGFGGGITNPTIVNPKLHNAIDVGDEALIHAESTITVVSANRALGAKLLVEEGCDIIVMDDGFQNPSLHKDYNLIVVNSKRALGNGFTMPAGPLRVPFRRQLLHSDAVLFIDGHSEGDYVIRKVARSGRPFFLADTVVLGKTKFKGKKVLAFAGIADPEKFYTSLDKIGAKIIDRESFGDHHYFTDEECEDLLERAQKQELQLVTTAKDHARLSDMDGLKSKLAEQTSILQIELKPENPTMLEQIRQGAIAKFKARKAKARVDKIKDG